MENKLQNIFKKLKKNLKIKERHNKKENLKDIEIKSTVYQLKDLNQEL